MVFQSGGTVNLWKIIKFAKRLAKNKASVQLDWMILGTSTRKSNFGYTQSSVTSGEYLKFASGLYVFQMGTFHWRCRLSPINICHSHRHSISQWFLFFLKQWKKWRLLDYSGETEIRIFRYFASIFLQFIDNPIRKWGYLQQIARIAW